jgi:phosphotriesterase-related protein
MQHLDLFEAEGVDPSRVIVGHTDQNADVRFLEALCRRGAWVQFDVIGKQHWMLDETRAELAANLIQRGFGRQLLLGSDRARKAELLKYGGSGYRHLLLTFVPMLRAAGLDEAAIRMLLVENPARALQVRP